MAKVLKAWDIDYDEEAVVIKVPVYEVHTEINEDENIDIEVEAVETRDPLAEIRREADRMVREAGREADKIVEAARARAEGIAAEAETEAERLHTEAKNEGYSTGYNEGKKVSDGLITDAEAVLDDARVTRENIIAGIEEEMVGVISNVVRKLVRRTATVDPSVIATLIHQGFADATMVGEIKVHISRDDYDAVLTMSDEIMAKAGNAKVEFIKNLSLNKSDCIIETPYGNLDCSLDQQLSAVKDNLYLLLSADGE